MGGGWENCSSCAFIACPGACLFDVVDACKGMHACVYVRIDVWTHICFANMEAHTDRFAHIVLRTFMKAIIHTQFFGQTPERDVSWPVAEEHSPWNWLSVFLESARCSLPLKPGSNQGRLHSRHSKHSFAWRVASHRREVKLFCASLFRMSFASSLNCVFGVSSATFAEQAGGIDGEPGLPPAGGAKEVLTLGDLFPGLSVALLATSEGRE